jgi:hypothetical protein
MGRHKIRSEEEDREYQKVYQRQYYLARKDSDKEYYKAIFSRTYYRKVLRNMNENDPKRSNVETKISALTTKIDELKSSRNRYARLDICEKVDSIIAGN